MASKTFKAESQDAIIDMAEMGARVPRRKITVTVYLTPNYRSALPPAKPGTRNIRITVPRITKNYGASLPITAALSR
jgi:hypothetical protein